MSNGVWSGIELWMEIESLFPEHKPPRFAGQAASGQPHGLHVFSAFAEDRHRRWPIERTIAWLKQYSQFGPRRERLPHVYESFVTLAHALINFKQIPFWPQVLISVGTMVEYSTGHRPNEIFEMHDTDTSRSVLGC